ncbi:phage tail protein [Castellaniella hirudinis]|uniref:phage tail protein n=1 Tax=Castellaniella hirudinis TaxID=1144617 RepID=UPI0039C48E13
MAKNRFNFPNGSILELATAFSSAKTISAITNAKPAVATSAAHGLLDGDIGIITTKWPRLNNRGVRVANTDANTFELENINTTKTQMFPAGRGVGAIEIPTDWEVIDKILEVTTNGGDDKFWTGGFLEDYEDTQIPVGRNPQSMELTLGDDPDSDRDDALLEADANKDKTHLLRLTLPSGDIILYTGILSYNDNPQMSRDNPMSTRLTISMSGRPMRYAEFVS